MHEDGEREGEGAESSIAGGANPAAWLRLSQASFEALQVFHGQPAHNKSSPRKACCGTNLKHLKWPPVHRNCSHGAVHGDCKAVLTWGSARRTGQTRKRNASELDY